MQARCLKACLDAGVLVCEEVGRARRRVEGKAHLEQVAVHLAQQSWMER